jgi:hypothetical protein
MEGLEKLVSQVEQIPFTQNQKCIETLDNRLQDIIAILSKDKPSGELMDLKLCSWTLHERYHMNDLEQLKWTFNHTKHRILKNGNEILIRLQNRLEVADAVG